MSDKIVQEVEKLLEEARLRVYNDSEAGLVFLDEAFKLSKIHDYKKGIAWSTMRYGSYDLAGGFRYKAIEKYKNSLKLMLELKDYQGVSRCHYSIGTVYALLSEFDLALAHLMKAKALSKEHDSTYYMKLINNIASLYLELNQYDNAINMSHYIIDYMKKNNYERLYLPHVSLGEIYLKMGKYKEALFSSEKALEYLEDEDEYSYIGKCNLIIAGAYKGLEYYDEALIVYNRALKLLESSGDYQNSSSIHRDIAEIYLKKKEIDYAFRHCQKAMTLSLKHRSEDAESKIYYLYATIYETLENYEKAYEFYKKGSEIEKKLYSERLLKKYKAVKTEDIEIEDLEIEDSLSLDRTLSELKTTYLDLSLSEKSELTDAFVEAIVDTIDMRDTTTSGHSKRIAKYSLEMMRQINVDKENFRDVIFTESEMKEMYYAALLHDIGKLAIKESILLKHQRLTPDRIEALQQKFIYMKSCLKVRLERDGLNDNEVDIFASIDASLEFIKSVNSKQYLDDYTIDKLNEIHKMELIDCDGYNIRLIDKFELEHLSVRRGNLVSTEWVDMKGHAQKTKEFLENIPWLKSIKDVPKIASSHHEKLDGSGYPSGLSGDKLSTQMRILSIVDIFEALTASDRPYKAPMSINQAVLTLKSEAEDGKLDVKLINFFESKGICYLCKEELESKS